MISSKWYSTNPQLPTEKHCGLRDIDFITDWRIWIRSRPRHFIHELSLPDCRHFPNFRNGRFLDNAHFIFMGLLLTMITHSKESHPSNPILVGVRKFRKFSCFYFPNHLIVKLGSSHHLVVREVSTWDRHLLRFTSLELLHKSRQQPSHSESPAWTGREVVILTYTAQGTN